MSLSKYLAPNIAGKVLYNPGYYPHPFKYRSQEKQMNKPKTESKSWSFGSSHLQDIDWDEITHETNRNSPLALIDAGGRFFVTVDISLVNKYFFLESHKKADHLPDIYYKDFYEPVGYAVNQHIYEVESMKDFSDWVEWAKAVKKTPWPKGNDKGKRKVTVTLAKV